MMSMLDRDRLKRRTERQKPRLNPLTAAAYTGSAPFECRSRHGVCIFTSKCCQYELGLAGRKAGTDVCGQ